MPKYLLILDTDESIETHDLEAKNLSDAEKKSFAYISEMYGDEDGDMGESVNEAELYEVNSRLVLPVESRREQYKQKQIRLQEKAKEKAERQEYERLKHKFEKE